MSFGYNVSGNVYIRDYAGVREFSSDNIAWAPIMITPITLNIDGDSYIKFVNETEYNENTDYYIINVISGSVIIDGNNSLIHQINANNYPGMFQNGTNTNNGSSNVTIQNFNINCNISSQMGVYCGWICQEYFGNNASNININNCNTNGEINEYGGGIAGQFFGNNGTNIIMENCWTSGLITYWSGGIVGISSNNCTIRNCYSTGNIVEYSGGIVGNDSFNLNIYDCYATSGLININCGGILGINCNNININNCWTVGNIGLDSGGIIANNCSYINITNCYNVGNILGNGGGIIGNNCNYININNCYNIGPNIHAGCGGIIGNYNGTYGNVIVNNCYTIGNIGNEAGGIAGNCRDNVIINNCYTIGIIQSGGNGLVSNLSNPITLNNNYFENSGIWNDDRAKNYLQITDIWISPANNTPYLLLSFNKSPYTDTNITIIGNTTNLTLKTNIYPNFSLINSPDNITINNTTGQISNTYISKTEITLVILNFLNVNYGYNISNLNLTIEPFSNNNDLNNNISYANNSYILNDNFISTENINIYLPQSYVFNGQHNKIKCNTLNFIIIKNDSLVPKNISSFIINTDITCNYGYLIKDSHNIIFSNINILFENRKFSNNFLGEDCRNINIFNSNFTGSGVIVSNNCKNINIISCIFDIKVNKKRTAAITGYYNNNIKINNCDFKIKISADKCCLFFGKYNKNCFIYDTSLYCSIKNNVNRLYANKYSSEIKMKNNYGIIHDYFNNKLIKIKPKDFINIHY